jgi:hypothetical protein
MTVRRLHEAVKARVAAAESLFSAVGTFPVSNHDLPMTSGRAIRQGSCLPFVHNGAYALAGSGQSSSAPGGGKYGTS